MAETSPPDSYGWRVSEETGREEQVAGERARARADYERVAGIRFAAIMMIMIGAFQVVTGLTAIFRSGTYAVQESRLVVNVDYTAWGWVHLLLGVVAGAVAYGLVRSQTWARVAGICIASLSAVVNLAFLPASPLATVVMISLDVAVIYAITVHGRELGEQSGY